MLTGLEIARHNIIGGAAANCYRHASYDLRIGHIIKSDGSVTDSYILPPHGIVEVVSEERICVPANCQGVALVKTSLCNEGLLTLSIGIVDPEWDGPLSSYIVNFGKNDRLLQSGEQFLRLVFNELSGQQSPSRPSVMATDAYIMKRRRQASSTIKPTFLDIQSVTKVFAEEAFNKYKTQALMYVGAASLVLAIMTFGLNFGNLALVHRWLQPNDASRAEILKDALDKQTKELTDTNVALTAEVKQLETEVLVLKAHSHEKYAKLPTVKVGEKGSKPPQSQKP